MPGTTFFAPQFFYYAPLPQPTRAPRATSTPEPTATPTSTPLPPPPTPDLRPRVTATPIIEVAAVQAPTTEDWLVILLPTQVYSVDMEPLWMAEPGDWFRVTAVEDEFLLAFPEDDDESPVWLEVDTANALLLTLRAEAAGL